MKPKFSKKGSMLVIGLSIFIVVMLLIDNVPKLFGKKRPPIAVSGEFEQPPPPPVAPPAQIPATAAPAPTPPAGGIEAAKAMIPNFELLRERLGRDDPFAPLHPVVAEAAELPDNMVGLGMLPPMTVTNPPDFRLTAIAMRAGKGIAIINGEILREGDFIDRFTVDQISSREATLVSLSGEKVILTIRQADLPSFSTSGGVISNIPFDAVEPLIREDGFIDVSPRKVGSATSSAPIKPPGE